MKTLTDILRDADPLSSEPPRSEQRRRAQRHRIVEAARADHAVPRRAPVLAIAMAIAAFAVVVTAVSWQRTAVDVAAAVRFEVRLAEESPAPGLREAIVVTNGRTIYLHPQPVVGNADIAEAHVVDGDSPSTYGVAFKFLPEGTANIRRATQDHIGRPMAILVDGEVVAAPVVRSALGDSAVLTGKFSRAEAERIANGVRGR